MSKATKRKHVTNEVLNDYVLPEGNQQIVKVTASRGNNLHEVVSPSGEKFLVSMPTKFRKNVWIKRGDFVLTEPIEEGDKVKAEIIHILYKDQIKYIISEGHWPDEFSEGQKTTEDEMIPSDMLPPSESDSDYEEDDENVDVILSVNPNRPRVMFEEEDETSSEEEQDDQT